MATIAVTKIEKGRFTTGKPSNSMNRTLRKRPQPYKSRIEDVAE